MFKLRGHFADTTATLLLDSGASAEFIDPEFARRCGLTLSPSDRTVKLADGSVVPAAGQVTVQFTLATTKGAPIPFTATFTATPLEGYDAILGVTWLAAHNPDVGWSKRTITLRATKGGAARHIEPLENLDPQPRTRLAAITMGRHRLRKELRLGAVEEVYALLIRPTGEAVVIAKEDPAAEALLAEFADVFPDKLPDGLPPMRGVEHAIELKPGARIPAARPLRHQSAKDSAVFDEYTRALVASGQGRVSTSPYGSMALIVKKKDGTFRVVIDYRGLNEITVKNKYPLLLMDELFDRVHGAKYFTKIDLRTGFHQIRIADADIAKTAFRTRYGSFEYLVLPMGLCNAPGTFMQLMNDTFRDLLDRTVLVFLDDILVFSRTKEEHIKHVREVLERLRKAQLYAKRSKCELFRDNVEFLGHRLGANGLSVSQDKVQSVRDWPAPTSATEVRSFLGLANFYRRFVQDFSKIAMPLTQLTGSTKTFEWGDKQRAAFEALKTALTTTPVLLIPDPAKPYTLNCDACDYALGATLQQDQGNGLQPVAYFSRKFKPAEMNYDTREKEFMALHDACLHWRQYLHSDEPFTLLSDHDSLKYHKTMPNLSGRLARWIEHMAEFNYTIAHIAGVKNVVADALSRRVDLKDVHGCSACTLAAVRLQRRGPLLPAEIAADRLRNRAAAAVSAPPAANRPAPNKAGAIIMPSQRCTAQTKKGAHCAQRTAKGQYCWNHLSSIAGLRIKKSPVPSAGFGLFAARSLPAGTRIQYSGDRERLRSEQDGGAYFLQLTRSSAINAARTNAGEGRWINDPKGTGKRANAEFVIYTPPGGTRQAYVRTLRTITKGEEIHVPYGSSYVWHYAEGPRARKRKRKREQGAQQLAPLVASPTSDLTELIRAAALADPEYAAWLADPPAGREAVGGVLWLGTRLCIPASEPLRTRILAETHDAITGAHFGRDKTLDAVSSRFQWDGLASAVEKYVLSCDACQRNKPSRQLTPGALMPLKLPDAPCQEWTQDAVTGLPLTKRGNDAIQVYVERLCKVKHFAAGRKDDGAVELARSFTHNVIRLHGMPLSVVSDRDPRFTAHFYAEWSRLLGMKLHMSTARHPQSDGQSEREIQTLTTALRAYCNANQDDWDDHLDMLELGFNVTKQASTQAAPYELLYGDKPLLPIDAALRPLTTSRAPAAQERAERMKQALTFARDHLLVAQERQVRNASRRAASFAVGDAVLLSTDGLQLRGFTNKLCSRYIGPFEVTAVVNPNAYTLALPPQLSALHPTFNISKLKPHRDGTAAFPSRPQPFARPPPEAEADSNGDAVWVVDRIVAVRRKDRGRQWLVSWVGYPAEENTWEPRAHLVGAEEALADFEHAQQALAD